MLGTGSHGQKQGLKTYIVLPSPGHNHGAVLALLTVASLTQALVWLRGQECGESTALATPPPPHAEQLARVRPTWLGHYNPSFLPTTPLQRAGLHCSLSTSSTWMVPLRVQNPTKMIQNPTELIPL